MPANLINKATIKELAANAAGRKHDAACSKRQHEQDKANAQ